MLDHPRLEPRLLRQRADGEGPRDADAELSGEELYQQEDFARRHRGPEPDDGGALALFIRIAQREQLLLDELRKGQALPLRGRATALSVDQERDHFRYIARCGIALLEHPP